VIELAPRQKAALEEIKSFIRKHGYAPTTRELADRLGIFQTAAINHIRALTRKGYIQQTANQARTITIVKP